MRHFGNGSENERTIQRWYAKFKTGDGRLINKDQRRPEAVVDNEILQPMFEKYPGNTFRDNAEELCASPTSISRSFKIDWQSLKNR